MIKLQKYSALGFCFILFVCFQNASSAVSVKVFMEDATGSAETNVVKPYIYLQNTGTDSLRNFYWCYYFTVENNKVPIIDKYNITHCVMSIDSLGAGNYRMKYFFPADSTVVAPGAFVPNNVGGEQLGLHYLDWTTFDKTNDYSFMANATFLENSKIPVFLAANDSLIYGTLPNTPAKPVPKLSGAPTTGTDSLKVQFTDSSTGAITSRLWTFGDNTTDTSKNALHNYVTTGSFSVKLVVSGPGGKDSVTKANYIVISASVPKPVPKLSGAPTAGTDSLKVQFTDSSTGAISSRLWTFGDNTTDTSQNPLHNYVTTGSFSVKLVVSGPGGKDSVTKPNYIAITASIPKPVAKLSGAPTTGTDSLKVQFIDSSTGAITSRLWTFGDNTTDTSKNPLHNYVTAGSFSVKLVVSGPGGNDSVTKLNYIVIAASIPKPVAKISGAPTSGTDSLKVQFIDSSTGTIASRLWTFGDNTTDTSTNPLHNYVTAGSFSVKLVVSGPGGKDSVTKANYIVITASVAKPKASFSGTPTTGTDSLKVQFTDLSTGTTTSRIWDFGDNSTDTAKNPLHDYTKTGSFSVKLVVIGPGGKDSTTGSGPIVISPSIDTGTVVNTIKITKITFDSVANAIKIYWTKDSTQSKNYSIGISCSATGYPTDTNVAKQIVTGNRSSDSVALALGKSILFDTTYYVALWLKRGSGPWTSPTKTTVATHSYSWQEIVYFSLDSLRDTAFAFNKHVRLYHDIASDPVTDSLAIWSPNDSLKNGFIPVSIGFYFKQKINSPKFYVGIVCDSIPQKYSSGNVRLYRYNGTGWLVERSSVFDAAANIVYVKTNDLRFPFIAMVDTKPPVTSPIGKDSTPVLSGTAILDTVVVSDNISNMECTFRCAKGANAFSEGDSVDTILASKSDTLVFTIPGNDVNEDNGVRAFFIASDGVNADTVNFSRQVIRSQGSDVVTSDAMQWTPLHVTAMPDSPAASFALRNFAKNNEWHYDPAVFRMFRWLPCSLNVNTTDKWIEYSDAQKDRFSFVPGNVFWLKSRQRSVVDFGRATTPSLVEPFEILLQPDNWTDIAVPYKFNIVIGDVFNATIAAGQPIDSLEFYQWTFNANKHYFPAPVYVKGLSDVDPGFGNTGDTLVFGENIGYSVLNPYDRAVRLSVVPVPVSMSHLQRITAKKLARESWAVKVSGQTKEGASLGPVYCGFVAGKEKMTDFFSAPPQLDNITLRVCDAKKRLFGHEIVRGALDEGGASFDVAIVNNSTAASAVEYRFEMVNPLPAGMQAMLVDPQTGTCCSIEKPLSAGVGGGERVYRRLVVGGKDYLAKIKLETRFWRLDFLGASPNPFSRLVRIRYSLPAAGISRVKLSIIGVSGRTVFETQRMSDNGPGLQEILWDGKDGHNRHVAAGAYVLRMTAFGDKTTIAGTFERKMTYMP